MQVLCKYHIFHRRTGGFWGFGVPGGDVGGRESLELIFSVPDGKAQLLGHSRAPTRSILEKTEEEKESLVLFSLVLVLILPTPRVPLCYFQLLQCVLGWHWCCFFFFNDVDLSGRKKHAMIWRFLKCASPRTSAFVQSLWDSSIPRCKDDKCSVVAVLSAIQDWSTVPIAPLSKWD